MSVAREEFFRRYATSPIHVPRLERLLAEYDDPGEHFVRRFIAWDQACADGEAARIVTEILAVALDDNGRVRRISDPAVQGAIRWMAETRSVPLTVRAAMLEARLCSVDTEGRGHFVRWLEVAGAVDQAEYQTMADALVAKRSPMEMSEGDRDSEGGSVC